MRDTFIFYRSFKESMGNLSDKDKLTMYEAIADYSLDMKEPDLEGFPKALFSLIRPILDANIQRWRNGHKGGAPMGNANAKKTTEKQPNKDKDVNKDKEYNIKNKDVNIGDKSPVGGKPTRFAPPSLDEINEYIHERRYNVDAGAFMDFYQSKGWMVGKNKMKDWRAAVRTWNRKQAAPAKAAEIGVILRDNSIDKYKHDKLW